MTTETPTTPVKKKTLNDATRTLFFLAARIPALRQQFGIELVEEPDGMEKLDFKVGWRRPWLKSSPFNADEVAFDPDAFALTLACCSDGERHCRQFILNVWNRAQGSIEGRRFDVIRAAHVLDAQNMAGVCAVLQSHPWP